MAVDPGSGPPSPGGAARQRRALNACAFFIFGLVNNVVYCIFYSAAIDILEGGGGAAVPKSTVLLANIVPCVLVKIVTPYFVRLVPYGRIVALCVGLSLASLAIVASYDAVTIRLAGIMLASASTGIGEVAFLALTTYYDASTVVAWSSGTGAAGIVGSFYYLAMSAAFDEALLPALTVALAFPLLMMAAYLLLLGPTTKPAILSHMATPEMESAIAAHAAQQAAGPPTGQAAEEASAMGAEEASPKGALEDHLEGSTLSDHAQGTFSQRLHSTFWRRISRIRPLIAHYIAPLFVIFYVEHTINQSVYFALQFPLEETPFTEAKQHFVTYQALYQTGVFLSRTLGHLLPPLSDDVWACALGQCGMFLVLVGEALYGYIEDIYIVFGLILVEGLLGGLAYVHAFTTITARVDRRSLEFSMAFTSIADSCGIALAALTCLFFEPYLCSRNALCAASRTAY